MMKSLKGWILGVALCGATFSMHAQQSEVFVPRTNVKLSALAAIGICLTFSHYGIKELEYESF